MELPLPNGAYGYTGVGAIYVPGLSPTVAEWSASKSPYYTYGEPVLRKGLVYYLNYAWDGSSVGPPESQVDLNGNRVWSLARGGASVEQFYSQIQLKNLFNGPRRLWGLFPCHSLFYNLFGTDLEDCMDTDPLPKPYYDNGVDTASLSVDVGIGDGFTIPANLFKLVITDNRTYPYYGGTNTTIGIFDELKDYPYTTIFTGNKEPLGALYYEETFSYTLTTDNWWLDPEYTEPSPLPTRTFTYTDLTGATVNRTKTMWMVFVPETFLDRTFSGAFRVYKKHDNPSILIERMELDSVTPDLNID